MNNKSIKHLSFLGIVLGIFLISFFISYSENGNAVWTKIFSTINLSPFSEKEKDYNMGVHFLAVGKADCSYIKFGDANILIDSGDKEIFPTTIKYLNRRGIKKLDLVIATHPHRDHIGQMSDIIDRFEIGCFIMPKIPDKVPKDSETYDKMMVSLKRKNVNIRYAKPGERIKILDLTVDILGPCRTYEKLNDNSVVAKLTYGEDSFLFMGDAEKNSEKDLIESKKDLKAEVLKVGHHGSKTSTTVKFIEKVRPKYAVISSGPNKFGLPSRKTIDNLNKFMVNVLRTDVMGDISFFTNGNGLEFIPQKSVA